MVNIVDRYDDWYIIKHILTHPDEFKEAKLVLMAYKTPSNKIVIELKALAFDKMYNDYFNIYRKQKRPRDGCNDIMDCVRDSDPYNKLVGILYQLINMGLDYGIQEVKEVDEVGVYWELVLKNLSDSGSSVLRTSDNRKWKILSNLEMP